MYHHVVISIITLRVIFCPLLCIGCDDGAPVFHTIETQTCTCSNAERLPCQRGETPSPFDSPSECPCPCDTGCVCKASPELSNRAAAIDQILMLEFLPVFFDALDSSQTFASHGEELPYRLDLESGRDIRIAHASFLL